MDRRELLKYATIALTGTATNPFSIGREVPSEREPARTEPIGKIALEEHFLTPEFVGYFAETYPNISPAIWNFGTGVLQDLGDRRIEVMDQNHIDFVVLEIAGPGVQVERDAGVARRRARAANDFLAGEISKRPARYGGFAHLAMQDPAEAAAELERCVRELGFRGP